MVTLDDFGVKRRETRLSNGIRVVLFERQNMPVHITATIWCGSRFDPEGKEGISHFLEHMVVAGTEKFPTKDKLAVYIEKYGGVFGASTGVETMHIETEVGDPNDTQVAIEMLSQILTKPLFNPKTLETERGSIISELGGKLSNPTTRLIEVFRSLSFQNTPLEHSILGNETSLKIISKEDIIEHYKRRFVADNVSITASGGISLQKLVDLLEDRLSLSRGTGTEINGELPKIRIRHTDSVQFPNSDQVRMALSFRTSPYLNRDTRALSILREILGGGRASRLSKVLRYEKGLVYSAYAHTNHTLDSGLFTIITSSKKDNTQEVLATIVDEVRRICKEGVTDEELRFAKDMLIKSSRRYMQSSEVWVDLHSYRNHVVPDEVWTLENFFNELEGVSKDDILSISQKYFQPNVWFLSICGDVDLGAIKLDY